MVALSRAASQRALMREVRAIRGASLVLAAWQSLEGEELNLHFSWPLARRSQSCFEPHSKGFSDHRFDLYGWSGDLIRSKVGQRLKRRAERQVDTLLPLTGNESAADRPENDLRSSCITSPHHALEHIIGQKLLLGIPFLVGFAFGRRAAIGIQIQGHDLRSTGLGHRIAPLLPQFPDFEPGQ
jgi:hypothetical protein